MTALSYDVVIVGAGISGIAAAHRLRKSTTSSFVILERRELLGGTWSFFKYPGFRTDSDMHTFGFSFKPWIEAAVNGIGGGKIMRYLREVVDEHGLEQHIRYDCRVLSCKWSSAASRWMVECANGARYSARVLCGCAGYYSYDVAHAPPIAGAASFAGRIVHPHFWDPSMNVSGKRVVIIGSGATAVTIAPTLVEEGAARVTVLQRSPTYIMPVPRENVAGVPHPDRIARLVRALFGLGAVSHFLLRVWKVFNDTMTTLLCDSFPKEMKRHALEMVERFGGRLAGERLRMDPHFTPRYNLWEERACLAPDGDFFAALGGGRLEVVTDLIERVTEDGILLQGSGEVLPADVIVTATGIHVLPPGLGDMELSIDGEPYTLAGKLAYKGALPARCPNLVLFGGYTRASWTLRVELVSHYLVRILKHMESRGYTRFAAHPDSATEAASLHESPAVSLKSGYIRRAAARLPVQSGTRGPWRSTDLYIVDAWRMRLTPLEDRWLRFS